MNGFRLLRALAHIRLLSPRGIRQLYAAIRENGINLMTLLVYAARMYPERIALIDESGEWSYRRLLAESEELVQVFHTQYALDPGHKVGFLCYNHADFVKGIFAAARLGVDIYLLNPEMADSQLKRTLSHHAIEALVYDPRLEAGVVRSGYTGKQIPSGQEGAEGAGRAEGLGRAGGADGAGGLGRAGRVDRPDKSVGEHRPVESGALGKTVRPTIGPGIQSNVERGSATNISSSPLPRHSLGKLVILTGGTTGEAKAAAHQPSLFHYLNPFLAMLTRLRLMECQTAYIATPIYHGYGVALLLLFIALGKKIVIHRGFDAEQACRIIHRHQVEAVTVVPLMLARMLASRPQDLHSLKCIASGGAELSPQLTKQTLQQLGDVLYNLYGTSEAGLNCIAVPADLRCFPRTIGKPIPGLRIRLLTADGREAATGEVGQLVLKNGWSMRGRSGSWISTGDLAVRNAEGLYEWCGRSDDMIVSGGENVYPLAVEQELLAHPAIADVAVIGVPDESFGERLHAYIQLQAGSELNEEMLREWLRSRVARYQMPRDIFFIAAIPYTSVGKKDKKRLKVE